MHLFLILIAFKKINFIYYLPFLMKYKIYLSISSVFCINLHLFAFSEAFVFLLPLVLCINNA